MRSCQAPLFKNLVGGSTPTPPPPCRKGEGRTLWHSFVLGKIFLVYGLFPCYKKSCNEVLMPYLLIRCFSMRIEIDKFKVYVRCIVVLLEHRSRFSWNFVPRFSFLQTLLCGIIIDEPCQLQLFCLRKNGCWFYKQHKY